MNIYIKASTEIGDVIAAKLLFNVADYGLQSQIAAAMERGGDRLYILKEGVGLMALPETMYVGNIETLGDRVNNLKEKMAEAILLKSLDEMLSGRYSRPRKLGGENNILATLDSIIQGKTQSASGDQELNFDFDNNDSSRVNNSINIIGNHLNSGVGNGENAKLAKTLVKKSSRRTIIGGWNG